jgi:hypothetical protein
MQTSASKFFSSSQACLAASRRFCPADALPQSPAFIESPSLPVWYAGLLINPNIRKQTLPFSSASRPVFVAPRSFCPGPADARPRSRPLKRLLQPPPNLRWAGLQTASWQTPGWRTSRIPPGRRRQLLTGDCMPNSCRHSALMHARSPKT